VGGLQRRPHHGCVSALSYCEAEVSFAHIRSVHMPLLPPPPSFSSFGFASPHKFIFLSLQPSPTFFFYHMYFLHVNCEKTSRAGPPPPQPGGNYCIGTVLYNVPVHRIFSEGRGGGYSMRLALPLVGILSLPLHPTYQESGATSLFALPLAIYTGGTQLFFGHTHFSACCLFTVVLSLEVLVLLRKFKDPIR